jgi:class 3 adenylate cyclase/predicted ATPase
VDLAAWLRRLGLEQYEQVFRDNAINGAVLPKLTADDLRDMGVTAVGHRRVLLEAIAALRGDTDLPPPARPEDGADAALSPAPHAISPPAQAERRQLTVMFVDLVGSTALSAELDPEEMREVLRAYQNAADGEVARFEGHVAKFMGDGVLAYFGWPQAHEDEAERAVRAGLAIAAAVNRLETPARSALAARVGIATGLVVVGDVVGEGGAQEEAVVGETPNLAARLQAQAQPGQVIVAESTRRLIGRLFEVESLGPCSLRGFAQPVRAFRVLGPGRAEGRFEALHAEALTPLVGREHELALLLDRWRQTKEGEGQVVLLSGAPGIGKSRIVLALRELLREEPCTTLRYHCSPYHTNSALWPVADQLERAAGFVPHEPPEAKLNKLEAVLGQVTSDPGDAAELLAALLNIPTRRRQPSAELDPQQRKARTFDALLAQLEGLARRRPVLIVLEDAHWIDATTTELFDLAIDRLQRLPALLVVTFRPEFQPPWTTHAQATLLTLNRLGARQATAIVDRVAGGKALPAEVLEQILARADGVPLFVEELTKAVLELGLMREESGRYVLVGPLPTAAIPLTLHGSLLARLDRLAPVKEVAQVGAVIGREFGYRLLAAVAPQPEDRLVQALDELTRAELLFCRGLPPDATYVFKHALVQEATYTSLLKSRRQHLHTRVAQVLEEQFPDVAAARPEVLAHHCAEAGFVGKAIEYWWRAGQAALAQSAPAEAVGHLRTALDVLGHLPDTDGRAALELKIRTALGSALMAGTSSAAASGTGEMYDRARELCERLGKAERLLPLMFGKWAFHLTRAEMRAASELADEALRLAECQADGGGLTIAHRLVGVSALWRGRLEFARGHLEKALALYDPVRDQHAALLYAWDQRVAALVLLAVALSQLGYPQQALARAGEALSTARRLGHTATLAHALSHSCLVHQLLGDHRGASEQAEALESLCTEQCLHYPYWVTMAAIFRGADLVARKRAEEGLGRMVQALRDYQASGARTLLTYWLALLAQAFADAERGPDAFSALAEADEWVRRTDQCWIQAELHRLRGQVLLRASPADHDDVEAAFHEAIAVAREQSARIWELRAARDLAHVWAERGDRHKAYDLLAPIYGWFTEGCDMPDLKQAKILLDTLS